MYVSYNWLKRYLPTLEELDIKLVASKVSGALAEVEEVIPRGAELKKVVVGEIQEVKKHPTNEKLAIAVVDTGHESLRNIVFAGRNSNFVKPGTLYPVCLPGGAIYNAADPFGKQTVVEVNIKEIDGEVSSGMLCSPKELGIIDDSKGISIVQNDMKAGDDLLPLLQDYILEIENKSLTHRPDCFSHRGIAREVAAILQIEFRDLEALSTPVKTEHVETSVTVRDKKVCRRFTGISMTNITVKPSPAWMQILLAYVGTRPINNVVDSSNFMMFDIGYPSHMYDLDKIEDNHLFVRKAEKGEKVIALNEKKYTLEKEMTVIADKNGVEDIAGIMGGAGSEISEQTKTLFIESAAWDMFSIRRTGMTLGLTSEASTRFSKGLDAFGTEETIIRLVSLLEDTADGDVASELLDIKIEPLEKNYIDFNLTSVARLIGITIDKETMIRILESLHITIENKESLPVQIPVNQDVIVRLEIPYFRQDLSIEQDIVEEIARIYGYENVKPQLPTRSINPVKHNIDSTFIRIIKKALNQSGLDEVMTYAFTGDDVYSKAGLNTNNAIKLKNPLSPELSLLRHEVLPSLLEKIDLNKNNFDSFGFFEISKVIVKEKSYTEIPKQPRRIAAVSVSKKNSDIFYTLKSSSEYLSNELGLKFEYSNLNGTTERMTAKMFHPYKSASINVDGKSVGIIGEIHPQIAHAFGYEDLNIALFDFEYDPLKEAYSSSKDFEYIPVVNSQQIERDINIWLSEKTEVGKLMQELQTKGIEFVKAINLVDTYTNDKGKTSITLRFSIEGDSDNPLTDSDINNILADLKAIIKEDFSLSIRRQ
ncbi:phenylalanine--tRNA ligase subunit beta [Candidatus Dojkabacteria bacterium]|uniref:Phenylalanine--tRNA ligase beta subunit n=1 Tax=Candidatus Dojkabacteria bacterium TaxID=2099670 RepID=A0A955L7C0_9BACT|nr:phenylalanine--tRNA ligase subunit beta [Candidatus Dojkabacteria bacterium]